MPLITLSEYVVKIMFWQGHRAERHWRKEITAQLTNIAKMKVKGNKPPYLKKGEYPSVGVYHEQLSDPEEYGPSPVEYRRDRENDYRGRISSFYSAFEELVRRGAGPAGSTSHPICR